MYRMNSRRPYYNDDSDYTTNAPSYYDDLARKTRLIEELSKKVWDYIDNLEENVKNILIQWLKDGTLEQIINDEIFGKLQDTQKKQGLTLEYLINRYGVGIHKYAKGEGSDEYENIQQAFNEHAGKLIIFPPGYTFKTSQTINVPENTTILGYKSTLEVTENTSALNLNSNVTVDGLEITGSGSEYLNYQTGFNIKGTFDDYIENVTIKNCKIQNIGSDGIYANFAKNIYINNCHLYNLGYSGIIGYSVNDMHIDNTYIKKVVGNGTLAYGVAFTRYETTNTVINPLTSDCSVKNSVIEDIPVWEGLDTHGGVNITFEGNTIKNCKNPIMAGVGDGDANETMFSPHNVRIINNNIIGNHFGRYGIFVGGVNANNRVINPVIEGNKLIHAGWDTNTIAGTIHVQRSTGAKVLNNSLNECYSNGIVAYTLNDNITIDGNVIIDPQDSENRIVAGISARDIKNNGSITNNTILRIKTNINLYVGELGITFIDPEAMFKVSDNVIKTKAVHSGVTHLTSYLTDSILGVKIYSGPSDPRESNIPAKIGSLFMRSTGGENTTLFIKESDDGLSTGWIPK